MRRGAAPRRVPALLLAAGGCGAARHAGPTGHLTIREPDEEHAPVRAAPVCVPASCSGDEVRVAIRHPAAADPLSVTLHRNGGAVSPHFRAVTHLAGGAATVDWAVGCDLYHGHVEGHGSAAVSTCSGRLTGTLVIDGSVHLLEARNGAHWLTKQAPAPPGAAGCGVTGPETVAQAKARRSGAAPRGGRRPRPARHGAVARNALPNKLCKGKKSGDVCRKAYSTCDEVEVCDGKGDDCPVDKWAEDGRVCKDKVAGVAYPGRCNDGDCMSRDAQCARAVIGLAPAGTAVKSCGHGCGALVCVNPDERDGACVEIEGEDSNEDIQGSASSIGSQVAEPVMDGTPCDLAGGKQGSCTDGGCVAYTTDAWKGAARITGPVFAPQPPPAARAARPAAVAAVARATAWNPTGFAPGVPCSNNMGVYPPATCENDATVHSIGYCNPEYCDYIWDSSDVNCMGQKALPLSAFCPAACNKCTVAATPIPPTPGPGAGPKMRVVEVSYVVTLGAQNAGFGKDATVALHNEVDKYYRSLDLHARLKEIHLLTTDHFHDTGAGRTGGLNDPLNEFKTWIAQNTKAGTIEGADTHQLLMQQPSCWGTVGLGWVGTTCHKTYSAGVNTVTADGQVCGHHKVKTVAHEAGHNMGFHHDFATPCGGDGNGPKGFVMGYDSLKEPGKFSPCNVNIWEDTMHEYTCVEEAEMPVPPVPPGGGGGESSEVFGFGYSSEGGGELAMGLGELCFEGHCAAVTEIIFCILAILCCCFLCFKTRKVQSPEPTQFAYGACE